MHAARHETDSLCGGGDWCEGVRLHRGHAIHEPVNVDEGSLIRPPCWNVVCSPLRANSRVNRWNNITQAGLCEELHAKYEAQRAHELTHLLSVHQALPDRRVWPEGGTLYLCSFVHQLSFVIQMPDIHRLQLFGNWSIFEFWTVWTEKIIILAALQLCTKRLNAATLLRSHCTEACMFSLTLFDIGFVCKALIVLCIQQRVHSFSVCGCVCVCVCVCVQTWTFVRKHALVWLIAPTNETQSSAAERVLLNSMSHRRGLSSHLAYKSKYWLSHISYRLNDKAAL